MSYAKLGLAAAAGLAAVAYGHRAKAPMTLTIHIGRGYHPKWRTYKGNPDQAWLAFDDPRGGERYSQIGKGEWVTGMGWPMDPHFTKTAEKWLAQYDKEEG